MRHATAQRNVFFLSLSIRCLVAGGFAATLVTLFDVPIAVAQAAATVVANDKVSTTEAWVSLFDGNTLQGWEGDPKVFRVMEGAIVAGDRKLAVARNEFLCTEQTYGDFELRLKVRLVGEGANAGIQFRTRRIPNHHEVSGYQADMGEGWWGKLYDESRRNRVLAELAASKPAPQINTDWNDYRIRCQGNRIQLWLNGVQTVDYLETDPSVETRGVIAVQIHGGPPSEAWYKDIEIREL